MRTLGCGNENKKLGACAMSGAKKAYQSPSRVQNFTWRTLSSRAETCDGEATVYSYVVPSIAIEAGLLVQTGCGPNFEGSVVTLCTCKHQMRCGRDAKAWLGTWIAGFTSSTARFSGHNWLVYLMRVGQTYLSQQDLVKDLRKKGRNDVLRAKAADVNRLGDIYIPTPTCNDPYDPLQYRPPNRDHVHIRRPDGKKKPDWIKDIKYKRWQRRPALLVGEDTHTYLWNEMMIKRREILSRGNPKSTLEEFLRSLVSAKA